MTILNILIIATYCSSKQDLGCGVGGPARNIARYSGAEITGLNMNEYQIKKATKLTSETNIHHLIKYDQVKLQLHIS